jgi:hypothetical protein
MKEEGEGPSRELEDWVDATAAPAAMPVVITIAAVLVLIGWRLSRSILRRRGRAGGRAASQ